MEQLTKTSSIHCDPDRREIHFTIAGLWTLDAMQEFLRKLGGGARPLIETPGAFGALGDLSQFVTQQRDVADAIGASLTAAQQHGLDRFAVVATSTLLQMQYRRLAEGLEIEFFDSVAAAQVWLRRPR